MELGGVLTVDLGNYDLAEGEVFVQLIDAAFITGAFDSVILTGSYTCEPVASVDVNNGAAFLRILPCTSGPGVRPCPFTSFFF